jgi:hypothetical protein
MRAAGVVAVAILFGGCVADPGASAGPASPTRSAPTVAPAPPTPAVTPPLSPPPPPDETRPEELELEYAEAWRLRTGYGLRADLDYIRHVAADPAATNQDYGVPLYPEEFEEAQARFTESMAVAQLVQGMPPGMPTNSVGCISRSRRGRA